MSVGTPGVQPGSNGRVGGVPDNQPTVPQGQVAEADTDAFNSAMEAGDKMKEKGEEAGKVLTPEEELRKAMSEQTVKQFMERSKEFTQEIKKNFEG